MSTIVTYLPPDCIGRQVKQIGHERRGTIRGTRKVLAAGVPEDRHVVEALIRWGDLDANFRWEKSEDLILLPVLQESPA